MDDEHRRVPDGVVPEYFPPQEVRRVFAAGELLLLVDEARLTELGGTSLLKEVGLGARRRASVALEQGAVVPAIGLEAGYYTVLVRSTETEGAMMPLSHITFSTGFVLGTASGDLQVWNGDRVSPERGRETVGRGLKVSPGWYGVTVVAGIRLDEDEGETQEWVCCFLLDPNAGRPELTGDPGKTLGIFG